MPNSALLARNRMLICSATSGSATMIARASTLEATAGAEIFTHVAFTAEAIVEAHWDGEAGFLAMAPPIACTTVTSCKPAILRLSPTAITVRPPVTASVSPDLRNLRTAKAPAAPNRSPSARSSAPLGTTRQSRRLKWLFSDWAIVNDASRAGSIAMLTMPRSRASLR